jgi:hypothetical protein
MRKLLTLHAQYYNRRHKRTAFVRKPYESILCDRDNCLLTLVRYIYLNPLRARIVKSIENLYSYPYCEHWTIIGKARHAWPDTDYVLSQFGSSRKKAWSSTGSSCEKASASGSNRNRSVAAILSIQSSKRPKSGHTVNTSCNAPGKPTARSSTKSTRRWGGSARPIC